ncbi:hypothetical protein PSDVSF_17650 [Pseudodesulfovibrio sediminis]|uniref:Periplasmic binding protein domain-containing protein n=2 Tax=Pseudodesulfovibrio sediminis TaxID=2810563 RepID=A0ABM7P6F3_9BACT|nr:hypothetical protein PSDVSF_17650 [Pseudodesulfovibrio sediminis]
MDLTIIECRNRIEVEDNARRILSGDNKPDCLMFVFQASHSESVLRMADAAGVKVVLFNADISPSARKVIGCPGKPHSSWIAHLSPDEETAGQLLAERLLREAKTLGLTGSEGKYHLIGLGGGLETTVSNTRKAGLTKTVEHCKQTRIDRFLLTYWEYETARIKTESLLELYPDARIYWTVSDTTALGAIEAIKKKGLKPGTDIVIGGVDWTRQGINAVRKGELVASTGGHFMEGGWAMVLIYDYFHGHYFHDLGTMFPIQMQLIDKSNCARYMPILRKENWNKIDFKQFTRTHNPRLKKYDFSPEAVVNQLAGKL